MTLRAGGKSLKFPFELTFWVVSLLALAITNPNTPHYSLCVFRLLGWHHCPGCGLGHAIAYLIRGNFSASWHSHFFGFPALLIILHRTAVLGTPFYLNFKKLLYGSKLSLFLSRHRQPGNSAPAKLLVGYE